MRFFVPILLLALSVGLFILFINPTWEEVKVLRAEQAEYDQALYNSKQLQLVRDELNNKYNTFGTTDKERLEKMIPSNVDNIRLVIEIERIAAPYGLVIRNVKYNTDTTSTSTTADASSRQATQQVKKGAQESKNYSTFELEFSTQGSYDNFVSFVRDLENSLRIVDITGLSFTAGEGDAQNVYKYDMKIKTYYLKS